MAVSTQDRGQFTDPPAQAPRRCQHPFDSLIAILRPPAPGAEQQALAAAIQTGRIDWDGLSALAAEQLLLPALWPALQEKNLIAPLPEAIRRFLAARAGAKTHYRMVLETASHANARRNEAIRRQALAAIGILNAAGIEPGLLKGTRLILAADTPYSRSRILRDIDLLVPVQKWDAATAALGAAGYLARGEAPHALSFALADGGVEIDLHREPLSLHRPGPLPGYLTAAGFWQRAEPFAVEGRHCRRLPASENLVHAILHTEVADLNHAAGDWPLRYLHETAVTTREAGDAIDWSVPAKVEGRDLVPALRAHLYTAQHLFAARLPESLWDDLARDWRARRHFIRCRLHARHPRSLRRVDILLYKLAQAMSPWYLRRKGYYAGEEDAAAPLWRARLSALGDLACRHAGRLPTLLFRAKDSGVPPPRV